MNSKKKLPTKKPISAIERYIEEPCISIDLDPIKFWNESYSPLSDSALKCLAVP